MRTVIHGAVLGPVDQDLALAPWLMPHQLEAARRIQGSLNTFGGAVLADAVGLGKTYVALALVQRYRIATAIVPASIASQWRRVSRDLGVDVSVISHEALSRGGTPPSARLYVIDEAHRFRNPNTRRYDRLAKAVKRAHVLLLTATPVVNRAADLAAMLRVFTADRGFSLLGLQSLERAVRDRAYAEIAYATAPVIVARSANSVALTAQLPRVVDGPVIRSATASRPILANALRLVDALAFPTFARAREAALLRMHLLYRLASSPQACLLTVRRHLAYLDRALGAARRGQVLSRRTARVLFSADDELQLELDDLRDAGLPRFIDLDALRADRERLRDLLHTLRRCDGDSPKLRALASLLADRAGAKTIVFTAAVATARAIATALGWRRLAVVAGGRAWIASGPVPVNEALGLFAPKAQRRSHPRAVLDTATLIATDLASEGLDLQDADAVVHYDLPWNPVRLEQRQGRIIRLGSEHGAARVFWFAPSAALERRLRLQGRIAEKVRCQLSLSVVNTSRVGQARVMNRSLVIRERLLSTDGRAPTRPTCHAIVRAPLGAAVAVQWNHNGRVVPELLVFWGKPLKPIRDYAHIDLILRGLLASPDSPGPVPALILDVLVRELRSRLRGVQLGATDETSRRLTRYVIRRAYVAGRDRRSDLVQLLDAVLNRVRGGLRVGSERRLRGLLDERGPAVGLQQWLRDQPEDEAHRTSFALRGALIGDGSVPAEWTGGVAPPIRT